MNPKVDEFLEKSTKWQEELKKLRAIVLECGLTEELKWGQPCYTFNNANVILLGGFKDYCFMSFLKGALLYDSESILKKPGEHTQSGRIVSFTDTQSILGLTQTLKAYIYEAIEVEKAGLKVEAVTPAELVLPDELLQKFESDHVFKAAFEALTPGRQRAYIIYFSGAKQSKSRESRIESYTQRILNGKGFNDCVCGLSKRPPNCDGSHKFIQSN
ncbi:MAG: DUF1801 domain-containing protein [Emticicia sp.]|uniref:DUF1801 domain-containing protein n=1 Tax=Emticicia sp. TaxID=1930953 RepID=UPI003BA6161E